MKKNILVLGSDGMVGRAVFLHLNSLFPQHVWGTTRDKKNKKQKIFYLLAANYQKDFNLIIKKIKKIDYVINCIGVLKNNHQREELIYVNSLFPHLLEQLAEKNNFKLIHISTDAIFPLLSGKISESSSAGADDYYSASKLLGETTSVKAITFRSSFIGLDPNKHKGLLEAVIKSKNVFYGYTNQVWTGCTSLQFAQLCEMIIKNNLFSLLQKKSNIFHFSPLGPVSKYKLIRTFIKTVGLPLSIKKRRHEEITRILTTNFFDTLRVDEYTSNINKALQELIQFESSLKLKNEKK